VIEPVTEIRISQPPIQRETPPQAERSAAKEDPPAPSPIRQYLLSRGNSALADRVFHVLMVLCALSIFAIVALIAWELVSSSKLTWNKFGLGFFYKTFINPVTNGPLYWDPVNEQFSAAPFVYGTLVSSFLALLISVPMGVGLAIFLTEMCPRSLRGPLAFLTELLAAIPSIIYGLWAYFVLCRCSASM
jgi:phosphate transport system permease protein